MSLAMPAGAAIVVAPAAAGLWARET
jgi:hypothetical protein